MRKFLSKLASAALITLAALLIGVLLIAVPVYKYHDCKRVGHSTLYCLLDFGH